MGGATSSTSKTVIVAKSSRPDHDVDYLFGQVGIDKAFVDWSGNCGNLSAAVGPFAITGGLLDPARIPADGICTVRIWQANIGKTIIAHVPITAGQVQETGDFELDGVTFPPPRSRWSSWTRPMRAMATAARCSPPANWWTRWTCPASASSRPR